MSEILISHSQDIQRLQNEGYELEIVDSHLLVHNVPYVNSQKQVLRGTLVTPLTLNGNITVSPVDNHQTWFIGEHPCNNDGSEIIEIKNSSVRSPLGNKIFVDHAFSSKPLGGVKYADYHAKMAKYIDIISAPARSLGFQY